MHYFGYTEEMLQTKLFEAMKQKQGCHEKRARTKMKRIENDMNEITKKSHKMILVYEINRSLSEQLKNLTARTIYLEKN